MPLGEILSGAAAGQLLSELIDALRRLKLAKDIDKVFQHAFTQSSDQILVLCHENKTFRDNVFALAEGRIIDAGELVQAAAQAAEADDKALGPPAIIEDLKVFARNLLNGYREKVSPRHGDMPGAFVLFYQAFHPPIQTQAPAPPPTLPGKERFFLVPRGWNPFLQHQAIWLNRIGATLASAGKAAVEQTKPDEHLALTGLGGIGKTAMAAAYARLHATDYPGGVYWLQADLGLGLALRELAEKMDLDLAPDLTDEQVKNRVLFELRQRPKKLLVLDNVEDPAFVAEFTQETAAHLLVTTRRSDVGLPPVVMRLPREEEALSIFLAYANKEIGGLNPAEQGAAFEICRRVQFLPLALEIMGKVARRIALVDLAEDLDDVLTRQAQTHFKGQTSVLAALKLAEQQFDPPKAREAIKYIAYLHPEYVDRELLAGLIGLKPKETGRLLEALADWSIVQPNPEGGYTVHRLVQEAAREMDQDRAAGKRVVEILDGMILVVSKKGEYQKAYGLIPHLLHISLLAMGVEREEDFPSNYALSSWATYLYNSGLYAPSDTLHRSCMARTGRAKGEEHPDYATHLTNLAVALQAQGKFAEAEGLYRRALEIGEKTVEDERHSYATRLNNLAAVLQDQGKFTEAEGLYRRTLKIDEKTIGTEHSEHAKHLNNLAMALNAQGKFTKAEGLLRRILKIDEKTIGTEHSEHAKHLNNLAMVVQAKGNYAEAEGLYRRATEIDQKTIGPRHPHYATHLNNLAGVLQAQGKYAEAVRLHRRALEIDEKTIGTRHPGYAIHLNNMAGVLGAQGKHTEAEPLLRRVVEIENKSLGQDHPQFAGHLGNLALCLAAQGKVAEAEPLLSQAVAVLKERLGPEHPTTKRYTESLDRLLTDLKK